MSDGASGAYIPTYYFTAQLYTRSSKAVIQIGVSGWRWNIRGEIHAAWELRSRTTPEYVSETRVNLLAPKDLVRVRGISKSPSVSDVFGASISFLHRLFF